MFLNDNVFLINWLIFIGRLIDWFYVDW
jgi:hypothetical protein